MPEWFDGGGAIDIYYGRHNRRTFNKNEEVTKVSYHRYHRYPWIVVGLIPHRSRCRLQVSY